ncbi:hypothetical protein BLNAU_10923 [Blattamonas nauphoetae]|uniref:Uncharacterized protein n=1 Tax=Blattamonas nauphoetae TaxID=2049346 RepID=A0ABQ9XPX0_9EUKA|nr:hypothetical protein BLNAU_10923 [Blattamonas nauphoetae]
MGRLFRNLPLKSVGTNGLFHRYVILSTRKLSIRISSSLIDSVDDEPPKPTQKLTVSTLLSPLFDSLYDTKRETTTSIDNIRIFLFAPCCLHAPSKEAFRKKTGTLRSMRPEELKEASDLQILMMGLLPSFEAYPQFIREILISVFTGSHWTYQNICQAATRTAVVSTVLKDVMTRTTPSFILSPPLPRMIANVISPTSEFYGPQMDKADHTKPRSLMSTHTLSTHNTTKTMSMHYAQQARTLFGLLTEGQLDPHLYFDSMKLFLVLLWKSTNIVRPIETKERQKGQYESRI